MGLVVGAGDPVGCSVTCSTASTITIGVPGSTLKKPSACANEPGCLGIPITATVPS